MTISTFYLVTALKFFRPGGSVVNAYGGIKNAAEATIEPYHSIGSGTVLGEEDSFTPVRE